MSDAALITEKANYGARAGETIAGNLARGGDGKFASGGNASAGKAPSKQSYGSKRAAANAKLQAKLAARAAAAAKKAKPGGKGKAKPKANNTAARAVEVAKRRQARAAEAAKRKADRDAARTKRDAQRKIDAAGRDAKRLQRDQQRTAAQAQRKAEIERRKAERAAAKSGKGGGSGKGKAAPKAKPSKAAEQELQREQNRMKVQAATLDAGAFAALVSLAGGEQPDPAGAEMDALVKSGLVERDTEGGYRVSSAGRAYTNAAERGDIGRAKDAMSRAADRAGRREALRTRRTDPAVRGARRTTKERAPDRTTSAGHTGVMIYLPLAEDIKAQIAALDGVTQPAEELHITLAYLGASTEAPLSTNKARILEAVGEWSGKQVNEITGIINGYGRFLTVEDGDTNAVYLSPDLPALPALRASLVEWLATSGIEHAQDHGYTPHVTVAYVPVAEPTPALQPDDITLGINTVSVAWGDDQYDFPLGTPAVTKERASEVTSVAVFKQANGVYRWLGVSSTAYQDRDKQYVSLKALQDDVDRADLDGDYGPLRFWHIPGVDLGTTDFNAVIGRSLVESGEISDPRIGHALATSKEHWQMSLGFLHSRDQPIGDTFTKIRRFERSILPASAASNPFTSLLIYKGNDMSASLDEKLARLKELAGDPDILAAMLAGVERTEKAAAAAGATYKEAGAGGAAEDGADAEEKAVGDAAAEDAAAEDEPAGSILEDADLAAIADAVAAKLAPMFEAMAGATMKQAAAAVPPSGLTQALDNLLSATKEATTTAQAAQATAAEAAAAAKNAAPADEITQLKQRLAELEGDQPRGASSGYRASEDTNTATTKQHAAPAEDELIKTAGWLIGPA